MSDDFHEYPSPYPTSQREPGRSGPDTDDVFEATEVRLFKRGHLVFAALAWIVILLIAAFHVLLPYVMPEEDNASLKPGLAAMELQGKLLLGTKDLGTADDADQQLEPMNMGPLENRFCYTIMVNEVQDAGIASQRLAELQQLIAETGFEPNDQQTAAQTTLEKLYADYQNQAWEAPSVTQAERDQLAGHLGWFGNLALHVENSPDQQTRSAIVQNANFVMIVTVCGALFVLFVAFLGFVGFVVFIAMAAIGKLNFRTENFSGNGRIYIETFAVWFVLYFVIQVLVFSFMIPEGASTTAKLGVALVTSFFSLVALLWPRLRGVPWSESAKDMGFKCKNLFAEMFWGVVGYVSTIPILVAGFAATGFLTAWFGPGQDVKDLSPDEVSHPATEWISESGVAGYVLVALLTVVSAPIIEETVFRGLMYRHLRDASHRWGRILSVLFAALLNALVFAAIHPQGIFAIPALGALAFSFSLVREWRGSLYAPMTMHAMHNGMLTCALILMMM